MKKLLLEMNTHHVSDCSATYDWVQTFTNPMRERERRVIYRFTHALPDGLQNVRPTEWAARRMACFEPLFISTHGQDHGVEIESGVNLPCTNN